MEDNGYLNQINNGSKSVDKKTIAKLQLPDIQVQYGRTESDAVAPILRGDRQLGGLLTKCLSCLKEFLSLTFSDICAHYQYQPHPATSHKCLYCRGNVHFYQQEDKNPEPYHYCSPPKQTKTKNK